MKKRLSDPDDVRPEYDFAKMKGGVRGKYAERMKGLVRMVVLQPDVAAAFPTAEDVNQALRAYLSLTRDSVNEGPPERPDRGPVGAPLEGVWISLSRTGTLEARIFDSKARAKRKAAAIPKPKKRARSASR